MDFSTISFILATCIAGFIAFNATIQPRAGSDTINKNIDTESDAGTEKADTAAAPIKKDTLTKFYIPQFFTAHGYIALLGSVYFLTIIPRFVPSRLSSTTDATFSTLSDYTCLHPKNLNARNFTWNLETAFNLLAIILGGSLRLEAYAQLGESFTYYLRRPNRLVTSGLYKYVQHPGNTGLIICWFGMARMMFVMDSLPACFLSEGSFWLGGFQKYIPSALHFLGCLWFIFVRVTEEEKVLKESFGDRWAQWHDVTNRFLPRLF